MKNHITDLRNHLFETLEALKDKNQPMDIERAKAVAEVSREIIASAKVEVEFMRVTGEYKGTGFIEDSKVEDSKVKRLSSEKS